MGNEVKSFHDQMTEERAYYLRKSDTIPGTDIKVADARRQHQEEQAAANKAMEERRLKFLKESDAVENVVHSTVVTPGVVAEMHGKSQIEISEEEIEAIESGAADNTTIPDNRPEPPARAALKREGKEALYAKASLVRELGPIESVTVDQLIDVILDENVNVQ